jgi:hypothetical protein
METQPNANGMLCWLCFCQALQLYVERAGKDLREIPNVECAEPADLAPKKNIRNPAFQVLMDSPPIADLSCLAQLQ